MHGKELLTCDMSGVEGAECGDCRELGGCCNTSMQARSRRRMVRTKKYNTHNKNSKITQLRMGQGDTIFNHCQNLKLMMIFVKNQSYQLRHKEKVTKLTHWLILIGQNTRDMMTSQGEDDTGLGIRKRNLTGKNPGGMPPPPGGIPSWWGIWPKLFGGAEFWKKWT